jgi:hypothetical protein
MLAGARPLFAETLLHPAENNVPVASVRIERTARFTEVQIETQAPRPKVCWYASGPNSPYLLAGGRRYRLIEGDKIASCPATQDYTAHETMVLRFEPIEPQVGEFSPVSRFRSSQAFAATSERTSESKGHWQLYDSSAALEPEVRNRAGRENRANFGFAALVEGEGGENQMIDPSSTRARYWNFLHVRSQASDVRPQAPNAKPPGPGSVGR